MHSLYFGCALDVVRFLHAFEDGEAVKPLGQVCHPLLPEPIHEHHILPGRKDPVSLAPLVSHAERNQTWHLLPPCCFIPLAPLSQTSLKKQKQLLSYWIENIAAFCCGPGINVPFWALGNWEGLSRSLNCLSVKVVYSSCR